MAVRQVEVTITQEKDGPGTYTAEVSVAGQVFNFVAGTPDDALAAAQAGVQAFLDKQDTARRNRTASVVRSIQVETHGLV